MNLVRHALRAMLEPRPPAEVDPCPRDPRDRDDLPLVTVVTICLDRASSIARTIESVRAQTYPNIEYIVLDGGSTDGTVDVIRANAHRIDFWRSAPDAGLYAALNEGVRRARGRFVQFAHSDDWMEPDQVERAVRAATVVYADLAHGDLRLHGPHGMVHHLRGEQAWMPLRVAELPRILHPTVLARRRVFEEIGLFRTDLRIAADTDWLLRAAHAGMVFRYDPDIRTNMTAGGISTMRRQLSLAEVVAVLAREPARRVRLVAGAILLVGTVTPGIAPACTRFRDALRSASRAVARIRRGLRRLGTDVLRQLRLMAVARRLLARSRNGSVDVATRGGLLERFARLRHARPDLDDATLLGKSMREELGNASDAR